MKKRISNEDKELLNKFIIAREKLKKYKGKGNIKRYNDLKDQCMTRFDHLIESKTSKYKKFGNYEDLKQDGREALLSALQTFNPQKGDFYCWATYYVRTKVCRQAAKHSTIKIPLKKAKDITPFKVSQMPERVYEENIVSVLENETTKLQVASAINKLPSDQKSIIELYFEFSSPGYDSITKICQKLKISRDICIERFNNAKEKLREELIKLDLQ